MPLIQAIWPVPVSVEVSVPAPVTMLSVPLRATPAVGWNFTLTEQFAAAASVATHVVDTKLKSVPLTEPAAGTVSVTVEAPVLVSVEVRVEEDPELTLPKATFVSVANWVCPAPLVALA